MNRLEVEGFVILKGALDRATQEQIRDDIRDIAKTAPFYSPLTPWGKPMSVKMTSAGQYGWYTDRKGYRQQVSVKYKGTVAVEGVGGSLPATMTGNWRFMI